MNLTVDVFNEFFPANASVTAGTEEDYNTMLIGWGALGTIWAKSAATIYIRDSRYTLEYLEKNDYFTISFFDDHKKDLHILGTKSGRDGDKVAETSLTPVPVEHSMTFKEAKYTLLCKKLYLQKLDEKAMPEDVVKGCYSNGDMHNMIIGEVVKVIK
jgi:flavin reductase (DIM6/NTAB) family NADH-FMN oxidoreductase RutF